MKDRSQGTQSAPKMRSTVSPSGIKGAAMNYQQFGEDVDDISFEIVCSYTEIYNEQIHDLLDPS